MPPSPLLSARSSRTTYLQRHYQHQRPEDQRQDAKNGAAADWAAAARCVHCLAEGIERTGADIAVDDADRADDEGPELPA